MCVTICGRFRLNEGGVAGYVNQMKSKYTNKDGNRINVNFLYDRITASGYRMTSTMSFEFAIYREAHWEIIVVFTAGAPLFEDGK